LMICQNFITNYLIKKEDDFFWKEKEGFARC
jgi:hypothetical protein